MSRGPEPRLSDLVDLRMIAAEAGVSLITVRKWIERHDDFPRPAAAFGNGRVAVWDRRVVDGWRAARRRNESL